MDLKELEDALRQRQRGRFRERAALVGCLAIVLVGLLLVWLRWRA